MGTTLAKLQNIIDSKADIKSAIEECGVPVGDTVLREYGDKIRTIRSRATTSEKYCVGKWPTWNQDIPTATEVMGDTSLALDWYPVLVDMSPVEGEVKKRPVGWLKRNNWLRFEDGRFAPTVGITEQQRAQCDVALYLDAEHTQQYCAAGEFDSEAFYNEYGMTQSLYDVNGNEVRILRPWETTEKKYSIFVARKDTVYLIDHEQASDGSQLNGIIADEGMVDGIQGVMKLVPTGIAPDPCTQIDGKMRCFFFDYSAGDVGCNGLSPDQDMTGTGELFFGDGTYPRVLDNDVEGPNGLYPDDDDIGVNQAKNAKYARRNNFDPTKPYPVAEGGYHALNVFLTCLDVAYRTKYLHNANLFSSGISSNDNSNNAGNWDAYGGVRYKLATASAWSYALWSATNTAMYLPSGSRENLSQMINRNAPKMWCLEAQMALSMAAELGVAPGVNFEFYGNTYNYDAPSGATTLLNGRMNARLFRTRRMTLNAYNSSRVQTTFDVECRLRVAVAEGVNLSGDIWAYIGGGYETIDHYASGRHTIETYIEPDQTKWSDINHTVDQTTVYPFQITYKRLEDSALGASDYSALRLGYGIWSLQSGGGISTGECYYHYAASLGTVANHRYRAGLRVRGSANFATASAPCSAQANLASYCSAFTAGSAQVLIESAAAAQPQ